jgi:hypothetical protein
MMNPREAPSFHQRIEDQNGTSRERSKSTPPKRRPRCANATSAADTPAVAVVFRNGKDTPRGAWFPADDIEAVLAGAAEMGMHAVKASTAEIISLAQRLPKGRIFDSGKLFTPLIQTKVYDELMTHLPEHGITAKPRLVMGAASSDERWCRCGRPRRISARRHAADGLVADHRGVAGPGRRSENGGLVRGDHVLEVRPKHVFKLRYRDYPDDPIITRHVSRGSR